MRQRLDRNEVKISTLQYQVTNGNDRITQGQDTTTRTLRYRCSCNDTEGNIYDLRRLIRHGGQPRFTTGWQDGKDGYWFSYNPCVSFSLGQPIGDCFGGDVAICMSTATSNQLIGTQSSFKCVRDGNGKPPQFVYGKPHTPWSAKILLKCDHKKISVKSANFTVLQDQDVPMTFLLTHLCACPNACTEPASTTEPSTESSTGSSTGPSVTPSQNPDDWDDIWRPITIAAGSIVFVVIAFLIIFRLIGGRNPPAPEAGGLLHQGNNQIDESRNSFPAASGHRSGSSDAEYVTPPESMTSTGYGTDITLADKNGIYKSKAANKCDKPI